MAHQQTPIFAQKLNNYQTGNQVTLQKNIEEENFNRQPGNRCKVCLKKNQTSICNECSREMCTTTQVKREHTALGWSVAQPGTSSLRKFIKVTWET